MKQVFYLIFLVAYTYCANHLRLSTNSLKDKVLLPEDSITSTLGLFKAVLKKNKCVLSVYNFNNRTNAYDYRGDYHSETFTGDCNSLQVKQGRLETDNGSSYLNVTNIDYNHSTIFTIDDEGVMRLIGTFIQDNRVDIVSKETVINKFKTPNKYVKPFSQLTIVFSDRFDAMQNERKWKFIAEYGQLTIYYGENPAIKLDYVYSSFTIRDSRIYDFDNQTLPGTLFTNITLEPRCADPKAYLDFKPPYVFVADPYWPMVTVYEQGGYKVITLALGKLPQYDFDQNITEINYNHFYSPCPSKTFEYRGDCLPSCPAPYYHQMKGESGFCVLNCEEYAIVNQRARICSCVTNYEYQKLSSAQLVRACPSDAIETPYGCRCTSQGYFWDGLLAFSCVQKCPSGTLAKNQVCMKCSTNCLACQHDSFNRQFLQCKVCKTGYNLYLGQCIPSCVANYGHSFINNQCVACNDTNCIECSNDKNTCLRCGLLFALFNGTCVNSCAPGYKNVYSQQFVSTCVSSGDPNCLTYLTSHYKGVPYTKCDECMPGYYSHMSTCVTQCPSGYYVFNGYCTCGGVANLTIHDKCLNQVGCPIGMSFDIRSHSCLSCPFGCISCINTQCTACNPGYFLYVSPQSILCRRKSPLFPCDQQYSWERNTTCMVTNYTDPNLAMTLCSNTVINCQVCVPHRTDVCIVCLVGYLIYNNTCIQQCPSPLIKFDNTCILPEITNCSVPHLQSHSKYAIITTTAMTASEAYKFYIYDNFQQANDPVGYMPYFQELTTHKSDGIPRQTGFFSPTWICLKCNDGYGISPDFKQCLPCPTQCLEHRCYMARNDSCLSQNYNNCYIDRESKACLQSCNYTTHYPEILDGKLYCVRSTTSATSDYIKVDGAVYRMKNDRYLAFFVFSDKLSKDAAKEVQVTSFTEKKTKSKVGDTLTDNTDTHSQSQQSTIPKGVSATPIPLSQSSQSFPFKKVNVIDGQYIELANQQYDAYLLDLSQQIASLKGANSPILFPNKIYGTVYLADHTVYMTTWLAYIGYIMSIVIILLHAVFIGNELLYKVDNLLIFVQTIYYFQYVQNLVGRLLSQFYFGWSFAHARFLPNLFSNIIPDNYIERSAPVPYKLVNIDGNYFRNAGFSLAWLQIFIFAWLVAVFLLWAFIYKLGRKRETWYPKVATQSLAAGFEFFSMNLVFFSTSQLAYSQGAYLNGFQDYFDRSQVVAIITLVVVGIYTIIRFAFNFFGGLYMLKRILIAVILTFSYQIRLLIIPLIILELLFLIIRHVAQGPTNKWERISVYAQSALFIGSYILLYFCLDAGVNTVILSVFIFVFIVYLAYDLTTLYLESRNEFPEAELEKEYQEWDREKANTVSNMNGNRMMTSKGGSLMMDRE